MSTPTAFLRLANYYERYGFWATMSRLAPAIKRSLFSSRSVLFYCDLSRQTSTLAEFPKSLEVERKGSVAELDPEDLVQIINIWHPELAQRRMEERFGQGALLWMIKSHRKLAGYGWTLQGRTIEPHYFPLGAEDVQFLDFHVFPKYRGRAMDSFLITYIVDRLAADGLARAFGEAAEWNQASLASFKMSPFRRLGVAKKLTLFDRTFVSWTEEHFARPVSNHARGERPALAIHTTASVARIPAQRWGGGRP